MAWPEKGLHAAVQRSKRVPQQSALIVPLELENGSKQPTDGLAQLHRFGVECFTGRALERHHTGCVSIIEKRHRADRNIPEFSSQLGMRDTGALDIIARRIN